MLGFHQTTVDNPDSCYTMRNDATVMDPYRSGRQGMLRDTTENNGFSTSYNVFSELDQSIEGKVRAMPCTVSRIFAAALFVFNDAARAVERLGR